MICLYIEDQAKIRKAVSEYYQTAVGDNCIDTYQRVLIVDFPNDKNAISSNYLKEEIKKIIDSNGNEAISIFTDYGIKTGPNDDDYVYITDVLRELLNEREDYLYRIKTIVIYFYQFGENLKFYNEIDLFDNQYAKSFNIIEFETSLTFNKKIGSKLYNKNTEGIWELNESLITHYSLLITKTLLEFIGVNPANEVSLLSNSTRELNRYIYFMNTFFFTKNSMNLKNENDVSDYKLSFISFINPSQLESKYGLDAPYKPYYKEINNYIEKNSLSDIFKKNELDYCSGLNYIYFRVYEDETFNSNEQIKLSVFQFSDSMNGAEVPQYFQNQKDNSELESFKFWIKVTYYQIYHRDVALNNDYTSIIEYLDKCVHVDLISQDEVKRKKNNHFTEYVWLFHEVEINSFGYKGLLNYAFHREFRNIDSELSIKNIKDNAENLYYQRKPLIISKILDSLYPYFNENLREHSLLNALSSVLNRNGSHNLGSHVLAVLSDESLVSHFLDGTSPDKVRYSPVFHNSLRSTGRKLQKAKKELQNETPDKAEYETLKEKIKKLEEKLKTENVSRIAYFNAYLKNRLDLLAAVGTSGETVMLNNKPFFNGVFKNFERNQILLEHISGKGDDFKYRFNLTINDTSIDAHNTQDSNTNDVEVAMPNDLLGDQAFYLLLENVIRNTAKHGTYDNKDGVIFTLNVCDCYKDNTFYLIELSDDNCLEQRLKIENKSRAEDDKLKTFNDIIKETNARIDKEILRDDFNIREGGWGTIEMKIACCYLSGLPLKNIDDDIYRTKRKGIENKNKPIIEAFLKKEIVGEIEKSHLGYRFYIQKPKSVLVIDCEDSLKLNATIDRAALKSKGIDVLSLKELNDAIEIRTIYKHQFIVAFINKETDVSDFLAEWDVNQQLPNRSLVISDSKLINDDLENTCNKIFYYDPIEIDLNKPKSEDILIKKDDDLVFISNLKYRQSYKKLSPKIQQFKNHGWINNVDYFEPYGNTSSLGLLLSGFNTKKERETPSNFKLTGKLIDASNSHILIIDERIQASRISTYKPEKSEPIALSKVFEKSKITVPDIDIINLNKAQDNPEEIIKYIRSELNANNYSFLIFHFGILEKIAPNDNSFNLSKERFKSFLNSLRQNEKSINIKIILTSGRGIPSDLPNDEYFCNFSSINYYLVDSFGRSKPHLLNLLRNLRSK